MKTTINLPEDLLRRAKAEAALRGQKLRELVAEGLQMRLEVKEGAKSAARTAGPLVGSLNEIPIIKGRPGAPKLDVTPQRIHELEMAAELARHAASLR